MCPRITIFSTASLRASWWVPTHFEPVLRQLDIMIDSQLWLKFASVLNSIIYLEVLYMHLEGRFPTVPSNGTCISLPALRLLELSFQSPYGVSLSGFAARFDVPRLRALSLSSKSPPLPQFLLPSQLQTITSLKIDDVYSLHTGDLQNLTQIYMAINPSTRRYCPIIQHVSLFIASNGWGSTCLNRHGIGETGLSAASVSWLSLSIPPRCPNFKFSE